MADETPSNATSIRKASSRTLSKKAGEKVPEWLQELAKQGS